MIFIDTNVFMYAVGRPHPLQAQAREFFFQAENEGTSLFTSAEVLQELLHTYFPAGRTQALEAAMSLVAQSGAVIWPLEREDVALAIELKKRFPVLTARDLCHLSSCQRRGIGEIKTFDRGLEAAFAGQRGQNSS
jgi:predicted nucleic acid-binding protein